MEQYTLDLEQLEAHLARVADMVGKHIRKIHHDPVIAPGTFSDIHEALHVPLPLEGVSPEKILDDVEAHFAPACTKIGHPRFLAWITTSPSPAGTIGELLSVAYNQAPLSYKGGPAATVLEKIVLTWFADLFHFPESWGGTLVSGGTVANLMGLTVARHVHVPDVAEKGLQGMERPITLYVSDQGHMSILRSAMLLGIGHDHVRCVPTDEHFRMRVDVLEQMVRADRAAGFTPFCVVAQAGSVTTGSIDPMDAMATLCEQENMWLHVDAAYGGGAMLSDTLRPKMKGIERADSICVDPHKWFFVPLECGITLFRDQNLQKATFRAKAPYLGQESDWDLKNTNFQLSRQGRALKVWFTFRAYGTRKLAQVIERNVMLAHRFLDLVDSSPHWEALSQADLSIACARFLPHNHPEWTPEQLDALQVSLLADLEQSGYGFLTPANVGGKGAVRICIANHRTTAEDIDAIFAKLTQAGLRYAELANGAS